MQYLSEKLEAEFGKGFTASNLRNMRQFYLTFPNCDALRSELSWTYYRILASRDKTSVAAEIEKIDPKPDYEKIIKDPYVLEFLYLPANEHFYESELDR